MVGEMDVGEHHPPMGRMGDARRPAGRNTTRSHEGGAYCVWTGQVSWRVGASSRSISHWHGLTIQRSGVVWCVVVVVCVGAWVSGCWCMCVRRRDALADLVVKHLLKSSVAFVGWDVELDGALVECCMPGLHHTD
jgi:hypothetical protein